MESNNDNVDVKNNKTLSKLSLNDKRIEISDVCGLNQLKIMS